MNPYVQRFCPLCASLANVASSSINGLSADAIAESMAAANGFENNVCTGRCMDLTLNSPCPSDVEMEDAAEMLEMPVGQIEIAKPDDPDFLSLSDLGDVTQSNYLETPFFLQNPRTEQHVGRMNHQNVDAPTGRLRHEHTTVNLNHLTPEDFRMLDVIGRQISTERSSAQSAHSHISSRSYGETSRLTEGGMSDVNNSSTRIPAWCLHTELTTMDPTRMTTEDLMLLDAFEHLWNIKRLNVYASLE